MGETGGEGNTAATAAVITAFKGLVVIGKIGKYNIKIWIFSNNYIYYISNFPFYSFYMERLLFHFSGK